MPCSLASPAPVWYNRREVNNLAKTLYCKKCNMDVPEGEACPVCGKTPPASSMRVAWMYARQRRPHMETAAVHHAVQLVRPAEREDEERDRCDKEEQHPHHPQKSAVQ